MSTPERRHSKAIAFNSRVAVTMTVTHGPEELELGVQLSGQAKVVDEVDFELVKKYFQKRHKPEPSLSDDVLGEHVWYCLTPDHIELIDSKHFGYERQTMLLSTENR